MRAIQSSALYPEIYKEFKNRCEIASNSEDIFKLYVVL